MSLLKTVVLFLAAGSISNGELTGSQIAAALGSPEGFTWTLGGPDPGAWSASESGLAVKESVPWASVFSISTTAAGPGVIALGKNGTGSFLFSVTVDGVQSGGNVHQSLSKVAVEIGAGNHQVTWKAVRNVNYTFPTGPAIFGGVTWEPFSVSPLQAAAGSADIALSTDGPYPWKGQDRWHHGDGSAVWSGVRASQTAVESSIAKSSLRADFNGPGIFSFQSRNRYNVYGFTPAFTLDGTVMQMAEAGSEVWTRTLIWGGPGAHVATWNNDYFSERRLASDFAIDEIRVIPELDFAAAVGTPGTVWNMPTEPTYNQRAFGVTDGSTADGAVGVLPFQTSIATRITGPVMIVTRSDQAMECRVDGVVMDLRYVEAQSGGGWFNHAMLVPPGEHEVRFSNPWYSRENLRIDKIEILPPPVSLDAAFGLPVGTIATGGSVWTMVPELKLGKYVVQANVTAATPAWFDLLVTGPTEISFDLLNNGGWKALSLLVDGEIKAVWGAGSLSNPFQLEVPEGSHVVRFLVELPENYGNSSPLELKISNLQVAPVTGTESLTSALDGGLPVSMTGVWTAMTGMAGAENGTAARPDGSANSWSLQTGFTGPGYLDFRWYDDGSDRWGGMDGGSDYFDRGFPYHSGPGWRDERVWFPPGPRRVVWTAFAENSGVPGVALDNVRFTPSEVMSVAEALPGLDWENDAGAPWDGMLKNGVGVAVSPEVKRGETSRLTTTLTGPGKLSFRWNNIGATYGAAEFRIDGQAFAWLGQSQPDEFRETVTVNLYGPSAVVAEWLASTGVSANEATRIDLDEVKWQPLLEAPLPDALDAGEAVNWETSPEHPFTGREDEGAAHGSSAYIALKPGEFSWLEATVNGPGLFDFWIRQIADMDLSMNPWNYWWLTIDGKPVQINGTSWQPRWIAGEGPHKIRLSFWNPENSGRLWLASAVDEVSWMPLQSIPLVTAAGVPGLTWETHAGLPAEGVDNAGRNGGPAIVIRSDVPNETWVGAVVEGPCELSWNSQLQQPADATRQFLVVDGVEVLPITSHSWQRMSLSLPAGSHSVRWVSRLAYEPDEWDRSQSIMSWRLDGMVLTPGISPLAEALDFSELFAVVTGDDGGRRIEMVDDDVWEPGTGSSLAIFDPEKAGKITTVWGHPDSASGQWRYRGQGVYRGLSTTGGGWQPHVAALQPGNLEQWSYTGGGDALPAPMIRSLAFTSSAPMDPGSAMEAPAMTIYPWVGLPDPTAVSGGNSAWSLINRPENPQSTSVQVTGPARVSFWWKLTGPGKLRFSLDGGPLPVAPPADTWSKVEFLIGVGEHSLLWSHTEGPGLGFSTPSEAWLDGLESKPIEPDTLTAAATRDGSPEVESVVLPDAQISSPWRPVAFRAAGGEWVDAARAVSGSNKLTTTVTGPAILRFKGRCFDGSLPALDPPIIGAGEVGDFIWEGSTGGGSSGGTTYWDWVINLGAYDEFLGTFLAVTVGETAKSRIQLDASGAWEDASVLIPAGTHQVSFQVQTLWGNRYGGTQLFSASSSLQGWIDDLRLISPANHYAEWTGNLPAALADREADADGDGASNFLEYAFGSDPLDGASGPRPLEITRGFDRWSGSYPALKLPYLQAHTEGVLQSSSDMIHWMDEPAPYLMHQPPLKTGNVIYLPGSSPSPQAIQQDYPFLKLPADTPRKFYRIRIVDPQPE